jgi:hypothetical protein
MGGSGGGRGVESRGSGAERGRRARERTRGRRAWEETMEGKNPRERREKRKGRTHVMNPWLNPLSVPLGINGRLERDLVSQ